MPNATGVSLGRDCSISVGGSQLLTVRKVSVSRSSSEIECAMYGSSKQVMSFPGPISTTVEVEVIGVNDALTLAQSMDNDTTVEVSATNFSGTFRVFGISVDEPLDDVVTYTATLKRSQV